MKEYSSGFLLFIYENDEPMFLLLKHKTYWGFPKGHVEEGESELDTALRELYEETGISEEDIEILHGFKQSISYTYYMKGQRRDKTVVFFLARSRKRRICISEEHWGGGWFYINEALKLARFKENRELLRKAYDYITSKNV